MSASGSKNPEDQTLPKEDESWKIPFVQKKMRESGFQLEDKVWSIFTNKLPGCEIDQNTHFTDWQSGESRELDLKIRNGRKVRGSMATKMERSGSCDSNHKDYP